MGLPNGFEFPVLTRIGSVRRSTVFGKIVGPLWVTSHPSRNYLTLNPSRRSPKDKTPANLATSGGFAFCLEAADFFAAPLRVPTGLPLT